MITVHHLNNSRSQRVLWLLEELGVPYEIVKYERDPKTMLAPPELTKVHPLGKSPVVVDDGKAIAESGAILEYLIETHGAGRLTPARGTPAYIDYRYFMHYAEGSLMPYLLLKLIFTKVRTAPMPFFAKPVAKKIAGTVSGQFIDPNLMRHLTFLNNHLTKHTWFAGDEISVADIQMSYPVENAVARANDIADVSKLADFVKRFKDRPAFQKAIERGGAYDLL